MTLTDAQKEAVKMKVRLSESQQAQAERRRNLNREMNSRTAHEEQEAYTASKDTPYAIEATSTINPTTLNYDNNQETFVGKGYEPRNKHAQRNRDDTIFCTSSQHKKEYFQTGIGTSGYLDMQQALGEMELADKNIQGYELHSFEMAREDVEAKFREGKLKLRLIRSRQDFLDAQEKVYDFLPPSDQKIEFISDRYKSNYIGNYNSDPPKSDYIEDLKRWPNSKHLLSSLIMTSDKKFKH